MNSDVTRFPWPRWPFYLADALVVAAAAHAFLRGRGANDLWAVLFLIVGLAAGAFLALLPHWWEVLAAGRSKEPLPAAVGTTEFAEPPATARTEDESLAEIAVLAWRIKKRAEQEPEANRVILRNAGKILDALGAVGIEVVSHLGRKVDVGSNVEILDAVDGEYNRVFQESDPQVQRHGRLLRRAVVTIGNGNGARVSTPARPGEPSA